MCIPFKSFLGFLLFRKSKNIITKYKLKKKENIWVFTNYSQQLSTFSQQAIKVTFSKQIENFVKRLIGSIRKYLEFCLQ